MKEYLELFLAFLKMGCITFGGGYAVIPIVERELIKGKGWITMEEVIDYFTIAQITPGIIAVNLATFIGNRRKGILGGILATVGFVLPGITLIIIAASFISNIEDYPVVAHAFTGIRVAVGALILDTVIKMMKGIFRNWKIVVIYITAFMLSAFWRVSPMIIVLVAGLIGRFIFLDHGMKETGAHK
jgi:chromate transporter